MTNSVSSSHESMTLAMTAAGYHLNISL